MGKIKPLKNLSAVFVIISVLFGASVFAGNIDKVISKASLVYLSKTENIFLNELPKKSKEIEHLGQTYFYGQNTFYVEHDEAYLEVPAPLGIKIKKLPENYHRIIKGGYPFYFAKGNFYVQSQDKKGFMVVNGPVGCELSNMPEDSDKVKIKGQIYWVIGNNVFKETGSRNRYYFTLVAHLVD